MPEIRKMLVLSTAHIPVHIAHAMDAHGRVKDGAVPAPSDEERELLRYVNFDNIEYGYLLWVPPAADREHDEKVPPELVRLHDFARAQGCDEIKLDCDGLIEPDLPTWEW